MLKPLVSQDTEPAASAVSTRTPHRPICSGKTNLLALFSASGFLKWSWAEWHMRKTERNLIWGPDSGCSRPWQTCQSFFWFSLFSNPACIHYAVHPRAMESTFPEKCKQEVTLGLLVPVLYGAVRMPQGPFLKHLSNSDVSSLCRDPRSSSPCESPNNVSTFNFLSYNPPEWVSWE